MAADLEPCLYGAIRLHLRRQKKEERIQEMAIVMQRQPGHRHEFAFKLLLR